MKNLGFLIFLFSGFILQCSKCQSVKGGSRGVKGGSYSQYSRQTSSSSSSQQVVEEPIQRQYYPQSNTAPRSSCDMPKSPMNGRVSCQMSNNRHICKGSCNPGFKFPDEVEEMDLECSQLTGVWTPYRNFPDCVGSYGGGYDSSHQSSYSGSYDSSQQSSHSGESYGFGQSSHGGGGHGYGQSSHSGGSHGYGQSSYGTGGHSYRQYQETRQSLCGSPKSPMNGRHSCSMANGQWSCQGTCNPGYEFPDGSRQMSLMCNDRDGVWTPASGFPDCGLLCHPNCQNGGQCAVHNQCLCPSTHRGNRCQYPVSLCDFNRIASESLYSDCTHSPDITECRISCPPGMTFRTPTTSVYRCTVDGKWNPPVSPECVSDSLCEQPPPPNNGRVQCQGSNEVMLCRGNCIDGYIFPNGFTELMIQCVAKTGEWSPEV